MDNAVAQPASQSSRPYIHHGTVAFRRVNWGLFAAGFATFSLLYCVQPLLPEFSREYGVSEAMSALSLSLTTAVLAVGMLIAGALSDAWGRKPVMVGSILASALLVVATGLVSSWTGFLVLRSLLGLTLSGLPAVAMTYLAEEIDAASIGLGMGLYISGNAVGGMAGRLITGVVAGLAGWQAGVVAVGLVGIACGFVFWHLLPPSQHFEAQRLRWKPLGQRLFGVFHDRGLPWLFLEGFLLLGAFVTIYNYIGYRLLAPPFSLSQVVVGGIFVLYLIGIISSPVVGHLAGKLGRRKVLWVMLALMLVGTALTAAASLWVILLGVAVLTFGFFGGHSTVSSWVGRRGGAAKAYASSLYLFCYYVGSSIAGAWGGAFYATDGWHGVSIFVGVLTAIGLVVALGLGRLKPLPGNVATPPTPMSQGAMP